MEITENLEEKGGDQQKINTADDIMSKLHMLQVTQFEDFIPKLIAYLVAQTICFKSGRLPNLLIVGKKSPRTLRFFKWCQGNTLNLTLNLAKHTPLQ